MLKECLVDKHKEVMEDESINALQWNWMTLLTITDVFDYKNGNISFEALTYTRHATDMSTQVKIKRIKEVEYKHM